MKLLEVIAQGAIQGITEFLPISSSGHLAIIQHFLKIKENNLFFNVALHLGTLISVMIVYYKLIFKIFISFFTIPKKILKGEQKNSGEKIFLNIIVSLLPLFLLLVPIPGIKNLRNLAAKFANAERIYIVGISLVATSILLCLGILLSKISEKRKYFSHKNIDEINFKDSFLVGIAQFLAAVFPGLSRSGSTLSFGLLRNIGRESAIDFSFIIGIPAIVAAAIFEFKTARELNLKFEIFSISIGVITSAIVGLFAIKLFKWLLINDKTWIFIIYTFVVGTFLILAKL
ncbi:MAG: undecaprenyl-diphosphate phosphatase [Firmicutes bacterium]|nr:undecaprenyl-diphosphate phosphatase [Bacillota bacterium]